MVKASAVILAGGQSSRMGRNKALIELKGTSILARQIQELAKSFNPIIIVSNEPDTYTHLAVTVVPDCFPGYGPLAGIHAGLKASPWPRAMVIPCDMPFVSAGLGLQMLDKLGTADGLVLSKKGQLEPLCAIYTKGCLPAIEQSLQSGIRKVLDFFPLVEIKVCPVEQLALSQPAELLLHNINTPTELETARFLLEKIQ